MHPHACARQRLLGTAVSVTLWDSAMSFFLSGEEPPGSPSGPNPDEETLAGAGTQGREQARGLGGTRVS